MRWSSTKAGRMPTQSASSRHSSSRPVRLIAQYLLCSALLCCSARLAPVTVCAGMYLRHHYGHLVGRMASVVPWLVCAGAWRRRVAATGEHFRDVSHKTTENIVRIGELSAKVAYSSSL
jgi:hypothetical protein